MQQSVIGDVEKLARSGLCLIQTSMVQSSPRSARKRLGFNQKTVAKEKRRIFVADRPTGPTARFMTHISAMCYEVKRP
jgi:hypothetical protein